MLWLWQDPPPTTAPMKTRQILIAGIAALLFSNCASVTRGTMDTLNVKSNPDQADIRITRVGKPFTMKELSSNPNDGQALVGKTPASFKLQRKGEYDVRISKKGYKPAETRVYNRISAKGGAAMAGSLIMIGGVVWAGVDVVSGAAKDLTPNPVEVKLEKR